MQRRPCTVLLAAAALVATVAPAAAKIEVGNHVSTFVTAADAYEGARSGRRFVWTHEISHPGATYIAVHFADFRLGPADRLTVSDADGGQSYVLTGAGKRGAGTFWAQHVKGDTVRLELSAEGPRRNWGFVIDEYVAGFVDLGDAAREPIYEALCGADDKQHAICYASSHPTEYDRARAVARLLIQGSSLCTGWLASADNHLVTNEHCISSSTAALNTDYEFMAEAPTCGSGDCQLCWPGTVFSGADFIQDNAGLDYCLVQLTSGIRAAAPRRSASRARTRSTTASVMSTRSSRRAAAPATTTSATCATPRAAAPARRCWRARRTR